MTFRLSKVIASSFGLLPVHGRRIIPESQTFSNLALQYLFIFIRSFDDVLQDENLFGVLWVCDGCMD